jgi:hypothetical protein
MVSYPPFYDWNDNLIDTELIKIIENKNVTPLN